MNELATFLQLCSAERVNEIPAFLQQHNHIVWNNVRVASEKLFTQDTLNRRTPAQKITEYMRLALMSSVLHGQSEWIDILWNRCRGVVAVHNILPEECWHIPTLSPQTSSMLFEGMSTLVAHMNEKELQKMVLSIDLLIAFSNTEKSPGFFKSVFATAQARKQSRIIGAAIETPNRMGTSKKM